MAAEPKERNIVIVGGGIIGCTSAYFLTRHPSYDPSKHKITILEASKIAGGASGKAGGLLGLWAYPSCIVPLSYKLHAELAAAHNGERRWGYRRIHCGNLEAHGRSLKKELKGDVGNTNGASVSMEKRDEAALKRLQAAGMPEDLDWVSSDSVIEYGSMGTPENTAQVHPYQFTTSMAQLAEEKGAHIVLGLVTSIEGEDGRIKSVTYKDQKTSETITLPATDVIISAGPWTRTVYPEAPISALRAHSVTIKSKTPISPYALFTEIALPENFNSGKSKRPRNTIVSPEIYARPGDEAYACGEGDTLIPLPSTTADVETDQNRCQDIIDYVSSISDQLRDGEVTARQACYLPNVQGGRGPLIGETGIKGLLIAAGHTCWGIQNGPGTGKLISEFVFDGKAKSANIKSLDPRNFM